MKNIGSLIMLLAVSLVSYSQEEQRPNILFIMSDDHTSQAMDIYSGTLKDYVHTPNISRLASEGCVLDNCLVTNSICTPSRATILTGQYSHQHGVYALANALEPEADNIAKVFQQNGYQTAVVGKWHLKKEPSGFDYYNVLPGQGRYWDPILKTKDNWQDGYQGGVEHKGFSTDVITDLTLEWLKNRNKEQPFLMMCHFKATHEPFDYPDRFKDLYRNMELPEPETLYDFGPKTTGRTFLGQSIDTLAGRYMKASAAPDKWWCVYPEMPFTTEGLDPVRARKKVYQKFIKDFLRSGAAVDDNVGRLMNYLDKNGLAENTIVIYTADQGYNLGEHGWFDKRMIFEESLHMPFVIRYPKEIRAGSRNKDLIQNIDFPALMADYAGIEKPDFVQGRSFRENLKGHTPADWRKAAYYRYWLHQPQRPGHFGIRNERYKLAFYYGQPLDVIWAEPAVTQPAWEFYDLQKDPMEVRNAYNDPQYAQIIKQMKVELERLRKEIGDTDQQYPEMVDILKNHWD
nr:sulfatase [Allomuricauda sp.]